MPGKMGAYLGRRQWGTVRDYSARECREYFPHDPPDRVYRWGEDGIAGIRRQAAYLFRPGLVERERPDPEENVSSD